MTRNEPTRIFSLDSWEPPPARFAAAVRPFGQDLLWYRLRLRTEVVLGAQVHDPRQAFMVTSLT